MKDHKFIGLLRKYFNPMLTICFGLLLLLIPDTASALLGKVLAWIGILGSASLILKERKYAAGLIFGGLSLFLLMNPLFLAESLGRVLGLTFLIWGMGAVRKNREKQSMPGLVSGGAVALLGLVLFFLPMTATRLVMNVAGVVITGIGVAEGYDRFRGREVLKTPEEPGRVPDESNIIDVEKL